MAFSLFNADALRALILKNVNVISKVFLAFYDSKMCASKNGKVTITNFFAIVLQYNSKVRIVP